MNNAELIKALRNCACIKNEDHCKICGYRHSTECGRRIADDAADALEAADKRIAELEAQLPKVVSSTIEQKIGGEWKHEVGILGCSSVHANIEIDGKEYVIVIHEVEDGHDFSEYIGGVER